MKYKITSLLLAISLLLSLFTVHSFASETISNEDSGYTTSYIHYKNSFDDESDDIGGNLAITNGSNSSFEIKSEDNGNKYGYYNFNGSSDNVYMQISPKSAYNIGPDMLGYMIFEMDFNDFGNPLATSKFLDINSGSGSFAPAGGRVSAENILNIANDSKGNYFYFCNDKTDKVYVNSNEWIHIRCELSVLSTDADNYMLRCYIGDKCFESSFILGNPQIITQVRLGSTKTINQKMGLDNITLYTTPSIDILPSNSILCMKVGAENARLNGNQIELTNVPLLINGEIYCPVNILEVIADMSCPSEYIMTLDGSEYIHLDDIQSAFGISAKSSAMGLIEIGNEGYFIGDDATYEDIADLMKNFIFNIPTADEFKNDVAEYTNGFDHPYLLVNADRFTELKNIYTSGKNGTLTSAEDKKLYDYINRYLTSAESTFNTYCGTKPVNQYNGISSGKIPINKNYSNYSNNGYDNGGRTSIDTNPLLQFAFAYQMTGNLNYARAAYDYMIYLGKWNHWGPDHFLNTADAGAPFAIAYDWLYDAFVKLNSDGEIAKSDGETYDKSKLATTLFTHVIIPGYIQSNNLTCPWPGSANSRYSTKTSNWNAVCASGVIVSALVLLEEDVPTAGMTFNTQKKINSTTFEQTVTNIENLGNSSIHIGLNTYSDYAAKLTSMNLHTLAKYGLDQYFPDGSYIESPSYWAYGTNAFFRLTAALLSAAGDDYGFMDAWGIDTTCYFAVHSESSDYKTWNFNDGGVGVQDSSYFFFAGNYYGDDALVKIRKKHLADGKAYTLYDILFYDTSVVGEPEIATEYNMVGIDAFSVRSSWDKGAIYAGIMGGKNDCSHGQMDAGAFIYHNKGKIWFSDLGADKYNMSIGYFHNYNLYRVGPEGHNILMLTSEQDTLPYGQLKTADPKIIKSYSGKNGGYAVLDMSDTYGSHVTSAQRGILFTNSRSTVVIQDEYVFDGPKTAYWFGHYRLTDGHVDDVVISADGRTAFMISGTDIMRVSIVSDNPNLKFEIMDAYTYLLDKTHRTNRDEMGTDTTETSRDEIRKLAIKCEDVTSLNLAVVIEEVSTYEIGTSYNYTNISEWALSSKENTIVDTKFKADFESDSQIVGSYNLNSNSESFYIEKYVSSSHSYIGIIPSGLSTAYKDSELMLHLKNNLPISINSAKYIVFDADIFTEGTFINSSFGIKAKKADGTTEFIPFFTLNGNKIHANGKEITLQNAFKHITVILDNEEKSVYIYSDNTFITKLNGIVHEETREIVNFEFLLSSSSSASDTSSILLDNLSVRVLGDKYDDVQFSALLESNSSISSWAEAIDYQNISVPLASSNGINLYTNAQIESALKSGYTVTLLRNTTGIINVDGTATVNTNGYKFRYVSDNYVAVSNGNTLTFTAGNITVKWHIGEEIITENYSGSSIASFKGTSDKIGKLSFEKIELQNGGMTYKIHTTAWANTPGGQPLSAADMIISEDNCEFWLVNNLPVDCLFVKIDANGNITKYYSEADLRSALSENNSAYDIVLCSDVEILNLVNIAKSGKNLYLNGYTVSYKQYDKHMFSFPYGANGNFNLIGPGTIESIDARTVFTSDSSSTYKTVNYGIVATNITILTDTQLGDLRIGQHKFINCKLHHSNDARTFLSLWNKNSSFGEAGVPNNLLSVTFEKCVITSDSTSSYGLFSYADESYSEIYIVDTSISTKACLINSESTIFKFVASGSSSIVAARVLKNSSLYCQQILFDNGVTTDMQLENRYLRTGSTITNNYDSSLPYRISDKYATVIWKTLDGSTILSELVSIGVMLNVTSPDVASYLHSIGDDYTYDVSVVSSTEEVILMPILKTKSTILHSMTIENDLTMHLYIQKYEIDNTILSVKVDGTRIMKNSYELVEINGVSYYKYNILKFAPSKALKDIDIVIEYSDGTVRTITTSAVKYLEKWLSISDDENEKILAVKLLKYIESAYAYFGGSNVLEEEKIDLIIAKYKEYDLIFGTLSNDNVSTGVISNAIRSVCFNLSASVKIRFYLNPEFTGVLTFTLNGVTSDYYVTNGKTNKCDYIEVYIPAVLINQKLLLSDGVNSIEYGLGTYATAMNNTDYELQQMLVCLSEYSAAAERYVKSKN